MSEEKQLLNDNMKEQPPAYAAAPQYTVVVQPGTAVPGMVDINPPEDQLMMSIFTTFCCFMPLGLIALIKAIEARNFYHNGRHLESAASIRSAKTLNHLSILVNIIIIVLIFLTQLGWIIPTIIAASTVKDDD